MRLSNRFFIQKVWPSDFHALAAGGFDTLSCAAAEDTALVLRESSQDRAKKFILVGVCVQVNGDTVQVDSVRSALFHW